MMVLGGLFGYLFQIEIINYLPESDVSIAISSISMVVVFGALFSPVSYFITKLISKNKSKISNVKLLLERFVMHKNNQYFFIAISFLFYIFAFYSLNLNQLNLIMLTLIFISTIPFIIIYSTMQGMHLFLTLGIYGLSVNFLKILFLFLLVFLLTEKLSIFSFLNIIFLSSLLTIFGFYSYLHFKYFKKNISLKNNKTIQLSIFHKENIRPTVINFSFLLWQNFDILLCSYFLEPLYAKTYIISSVIGKGIIFASISLTTMVYPMLLANKASTKIFNFQLLFLSISIVMVFGLSFATILYFFSESLLSFFYLSFDSSSIFILSMYGFVLLPYLIINIVEHFALADDKLFYSWVLIPLILLVFLICIFLKINTFDVLFIYGLVGIVSLILGSFFFLRSFKCKQ